MPRIGGALDIVQVSDPATPQAGRQHLYFKSDGILYTKKSNGTVAPIGGGFTNIGSGPGIDPTGATSSSAALQAKIDAMPIGGGVLFLPPGVYLLTVPLVLKPNVTLAGDGYGITILKVEGAIKGLMYEPTTLIEANIKLLSLRVLGTTSALDLVSFKNCADIVIRDCGFRETSMNAIKLDACYNITIHGTNRIENFVQNGIYLYLCNVFSIDGVDLNANAVTQAALLRCEASGWGAIRNGNFEGLNVTYVGILLIGSNCISIEDNFMEFMLAPAIAATTTICRNIYIARNHVHGNDSIQIDFSSGSIDHQNIVLDQNWTPNTTGYLFHPGASVNWECRNSRTDGAIHVVGNSSGTTHVRSGDVNLIGTMKFGVTGDTNLYRVGPSYLKTDGDFAVGYDMVARPGALGQTVIGARGPGGEGGVTLGSDTALYRASAGVIRTSGKYTADGGLGVGNSVAASAVTTVTRKMQVFDSAGNALGYVYIYGS